MDKKRAVTYNLGMKIFKKIWGGNTLYYPGCLTKFVCKDQMEKYKKILSLEGIDFIMLKDNELCCGSPVKNAGAKKVFEELARKNLAVFREHGVNRIVSNCPSCTAVFKKDYKKILGDEWDIEVLHISEVIDKSLSKLIKVEKNKQATFHDPCHLGRSLGIFDQPRAIIKQAGYKLVEMEYSREKSACCGAGGGVKGNASELSGRIREDRVTQARKAKADVLITNCPMCNKQLAENAQKMKVLELCDLFDV
jgi:heterodisulfide reductase subunit D